MMKRFDLPSEKLVLLRETHEPLNVRKLVCVRHVRSHNSQNDSNYLQCCRMPSGNIVISNPPVISGTSLVVFITLGLVGTYARKISGFFFGKPQRFPFLDNISESDCDKIGAFLTRPCCPFPSCVVRGELRER